MYDPTLSRRGTVGLICGLGVAALVPSAAVAAMTAPQIEQAARAKLQKLYETSPKSREIGARARGILIFPPIVKAG